MDYGWINDFIYTVGSFRNLQRVWATYYFPHLQRTHPRLGDPHALMIGSEIPMGEIYDHNKYPLRGLLDILLRLVQVPTVQSIGFAPVFRDLLEFQSYRFQSARFIYHSLYGIRIDGFLTRLLKQDFCGKLSGLAVHECSVRIFHTCHVNTLRKLQVDGLIWDSHAPYSHILLSTVLPRLSELEILVLKNAFSTKYPPNIRELYIETGPVHGCDREDDGGNPEADFNALVAIGGLRHLSILKLDNPSWKILDVLKIRDTLETSTQFHCTQLQHVAIIGKGCEWALDSGGGWLTSEILYKCHELRSLKISARHLHDGILPEKLQEVEVEVGPGEFNVAAVAIAAAYNLRKATLILGPLVDSQENFHESITTIAANCPMLRHIQIVLQHSNDFALLQRQFPARWYRKIDNTTFRINTRKEDCE
jgi:hypothetical protein